MLRLILTRRGKTSFTLNKYLICIFHNERSNLTVFSRLETYMPIDLKLRSHKEMQNIEFVSDFKKITTTE